MSGKKYPTKRPKLRKDVSLGYITEICPHCEEEIPRSIFVEHTTHCGGYSSYFLKQSVLGNTRSLLRGRFSSRETLLGCETSTSESSTSRRKLTYLPPFSPITEADDSKIGITASNSKESTESEYKGTVRLIQNLEDLLQNSWCSDVVLENTDQEFHAHRLILGMRSPVFASMFQHDMVEKKTGKVDISDCSTAGFKEFLRFLYSGSANVSSTTVVDLFYIADKYQVDDLKTYCVDFMKNSLSIDTVCHVISLAARHSQSDLQRNATQFFCRNIKVIVKSSQWQNFLIEDPVLANELIIEALNA